MSIAVHCIVNCVLNDDKKTFLYLHSTALTSDCFRLDSEFNIFCGPGASHRFIQINFTSDQIALLFVSFY